MNEFISRESALDVLNKLARDNFTLQEAFSFYLGALHDAADGIKNIPTVDVAPIVHGRWKGEGMGDYRCSLCGFIVSGNGYRFCPACGAMMEDPTQTQHVESVGQHTQDVGMR